MKILIFSDLHLHNYKQYNRQESRLSGILTILRAIYDYADKNNITTVLFGGDWYDNQKLLPTEAVNRGLATMQEIEKAYPSITTIAISGNHDYASKNLWHQPAVTAIDHLEEVLTNFKKIDLKYFDIPGEKPAVVYGIPYYEYPEHYKLALEHMQKVAAVGREGVRKILLIHQTPTGLGNPNIPVDTDVNDPLYDAFDKVYCGHIHIRQEITSKFTIIGNPLQRDFGDEGQAKGFYVYDTETGTDEFVSLKGLYTEFKTVVLEEEESITEEDMKNFYCRPLHKASRSLTALGSSANIEEDFSQELAPEVLVENYFKSEGNGDKERLKIGLGCLQ